MPTDDNRGDSSTEGGQTGGKTKVPVIPPAAMLTVAGIASLVAALAFFVACLGEGNPLLLDLGILAAILAIILDSLAAGTLGGQTGGATRVPVVPPAGLAKTTAATVATAAGLLVVLLACVSEHYPGISAAGAAALLGAAILDFLAAYEVSKADSESSS